MKCCFSELSTILNPDGCLHDNSTQLYIITDIASSGSPLSSKVITLHQFQSIGCLASPWDHGQHATIAHERKVSWSSSMFLQDGKFQNVMAVTVELKPWPSWRLSLLGDLELSKLFMVLHIPSAVSSNIPECLIASPRSQSVPLLPMLDEALGIHWKISWPVHFSVSATTVNGNMTEPIYFTWVPKELIPSGLDPSCSNLSFGANYFEKLGIPRHLIRLISWGIQRLQELLNYTTLSEEFLVSFVVPIYWPDTALMLYGFELRQWKIAYSFSDALSDSARVQWKMAWSLCYACSVIGNGNISRRSIYDYGTKLRKGKDCLMLINDLSLSAGILFALEYAEFQASLLANCVVIRSLGVATANGFLHVPAADCDALFNSEEKLYQCIIQMLELQWDPGDCFVLVWRHENLASTHDACPRLGITTLHVTWDPRGST